MHTSDRLLKFAAECEAMAKIARDRENKIMWSGLAQRWLRCADLTNQLDSNLHRRDSGRRRALKNFVH
jgi:hypothetical protein